MKRVLTIALAVALVCSLGASAAYAGPGCCKSKMDTKDTKMSSLTACAMGDFPHLTMLVGDKEYDCPASAEKDAEAKGMKVRFAVCDENFECRDKAMAALAAASERYVKRYTTIAAVVDGKLIYNQEDMAGCKSACAEGKGAKAVLAAAGEGSSCSKAKAAAASAGEGKSCSAAKAELAKAEAGSCSKTKAALASAEGKAEGSGCCKAKAAMASASGSSCCKSGSGKTAMAVVSKDEFTKLMKAEGAKFMVLGRNFDCYESATKARDTAMASMKVVKMKYIVDGKEVSCATEVCPMAKKDGKVQYVVGEDKTNCEDIARVNLAKAQYDAAKKAADQKLAQM